VSVERPFSRHLSELVSELAGRDARATAVLDGALTLSYAELEERIDAVAGGLRALGVGSGSTIGLLCTNRWEWLAAAIGAQRIGARVAAFNTFAKAWDLEYMLSHSATEVLICVASFRARDYRDTLRELVPELAAPEWSSERFPTLRHVVVIGEAPELPGVKTLADVMAAAEPLAPVPVSAADDAFILYTSGSSARPKAVPMQHYATIENGFSIGERMGLDREDRVFVSVPLFWAYGAVNALPATLTHGAALVLQAAFEPRGALDLIEQYRCTAIYTLPNMTGALLAAEGFASARVASLRTGLMLGTEAEIRRTLEELGVAKICNIYGGTETYGNCCVTPSDWPAARRLTSQGPALPGVRLRIADPATGELLPTGTVGEIQVTGYVARGYVADESVASAQTFGADGWYRSGDLGSLDDEGGLHFQSRATEMIKTGGINVAPREVEEFLALHPAIQNVAVVGVPDERLAEVVVAFVVARAGEGLTEPELRAYCAERIASFKVPARIHVIPELPATDTGKLARRALVDLDQTQSRSTAGAPRGSGKSLRCTASIHEP
jgi:fatty-acyl-CoA synthase